MGILRKISILIIFITGVSCESVEPFSLTKVEFSSSTKKINGYYYFKANEGYKLFFLNKNGFYVFIEVLSSPKNIQELDKNLIAVIKNINTVKSTYHYGIFNVVNNDIKIERWLSGNGGKYPVQYLSGKFENDSTILITQKVGDEIYRKKNKPVYNINELYNFRSYSPKPDSTHKLIK
jgi:hypothetical protein